MQEANSETRRAASSKNFQGERRGAGGTASTIKPNSYLDLHVILGTTWTGHDGGDLFVMCCGPCGDMGRKIPSFSARPSSSGEQINVQDRCRHCARGRGTSGFSSLDSMISG